MRSSTPGDQRSLPALGIGITNLVERATAAASELTGAELREGARVLETKAQDYRPPCVAVLGLGAYRTAFGRPLATVGPQPESLSGTSLWLLPNPSGLQARYQMPEMTTFFRALYLATGARLTTLSGAGGAEAGRVRATGTSYQRARASEGKGGRSYGLGEANQRWSRRRHVPK